MAISEYTDIDFNSRIKAIRDVGFALGVGNANLPSNLASSDKMSCLYWINKLRESQALPRLPSLDYSGFVPALNAIIVAGGALAAPSVVELPVIESNGAFAVGNTFSTSNGSWLNEPTSFTYQWQTDGVDNVGATNKFYVTQEADAGKTVTCIVTATNATGSKTGVSNGLEVYA